MNDLKKRWKKMNDRIDAMSLRERVMVFIAIVVSLISIINALLINPLLAQQKQLSEQIVQTQKTTAIMQGQIGTLLKMSNTDPNTALKRRLAELRAQSALSGKTLDNIQNRLVTPQQMPALLEDLLRHHESVHLIALKTLPVEALNGDDQNAVQATGETTDKSANKVTDKTTPPPAKSTSPVTNHVYKHGVEITVTGSYQDLIHYLTAVEALPWRMFWGKAELNVDDAHTITLTLWLYTLSQDQAWISL